MRNSARLRTGEFTENPWEDIEMPEGFKPEKNIFLNPKSIDEKTAMAEYHSLLSRIIFKTIVTPGGIEGTLEEGAEKQAEFDADEIEQLKQDEGRYPCLQMMRRQGKSYFASVGDFYKQFKHMAEGNVGGEYTDMINFVLRQFKGKTIMTSTRGEYSMSDIEAQVTSHYKSDREETKTTELRVWQGFTALNEDSTINGRHLDYEPYLQALLETEDSVDEMVGVFQNVFGEDCAVLLKTPECEQGKRVVKACTIKYDRAANTLLIDADADLDTQGARFNARYDLEGFK